MYLQFKLLQLITAVAICDYLYNKKSYIIRSNKPYIDIIGLYTLGNICLISQGC